MTVEKKDRAKKTKSEAVAPEVAAPKVEACLHFDPNTKKTTYNGHVLEIGKPFPGYTNTTGNTPDTTIKVLGKDLPYIVSRLDTKHFRWLWDGLDKIADDSRHQVCLISISAEDVLKAAAKNFSLEKQKINKKIYFYNVDVKQALRQTCSCVPKNTLTFPDMFKAKDDARYRNTMKNLLMAALKPNLRARDFLAKKYKVHKTHIHHNIYRIQKEELIKVVRRCDRFHRTFYPTDADYGRFSLGLKSKVEEADNKGPAEKKLQHCLNSQQLEEKLADVLKEMARLGISKDKISQTVDSLWKESVKKEKAKAKSS
ncbi:hypothetical protein BGX29_011777 [Mortierella sp. GBA35]|nr:hypothetical protein BGX29_011777 [Mortierella sp. GBA35]